MQEMRETQVGSLGWEDSLEMGVATHSNILAWRTPWIEEPGGLQSMESQRVRPTEHIHTYKEKMHSEQIRMVAIGQGEGNWNGG